MSKRIRICLTFITQGFYVATDVPSDSPLSGRLFMGQKIWPSPTSLAKEAFQSPCEAYYTAIHDLSLLVLNLVAETLPYDTSIFKTMSSNTPLCPLRLLHYPPSAKTTSKPQFGASAHTDFGAITLLLQDSNPGLEVLDQNTNSWTPINPTPEAYVVNLGDMVSQLTGGAYKSSVHRVVNKNPTDRYSIVFFFDGNLDCPLVPLDGSDAGGKPATVEEHMLERLSTTYGRNGDKS